MRATTKPRITFLLAGALIILTSCSSTSKSTPELSAMAGKKVALVQIEGEPTARAIAEVALINELMRRGSFELISKREIEAARKDPAQDPIDWRGIGKRAGADFALHVKVVDFTADTQEGYSTIEEEDSQMAAERGESGRTVQRTYKVRSMHGKVGYTLEFADLKSGNVRLGAAETSDQVTVEAKQGGAHLPPKLRFLERLSQEAFRKFFDQHE